MSQNFDIGLRFCFMVCRRRNFEKNHKSYTFFIIKSELRPEQKNLNPASLDKNVLNPHSEFCTCRLNIKRDIRVQKIKVKILAINSLSV